MYTRPKLSVVTSTAQSLSRPSLSLKSPGPFPRTPISPVPPSPGGKRFSSIQAPSYNYTNSCKSKSILKKQPMAAATTHTEKRIQFQGAPTVHCVTPIENPEEYYGTYTKLSKEERRWMICQIPDLTVESLVRGDRHLLASAPGSDFGISPKSQASLNTALSVQRWDFDDGHWEEIPARETTRESVCI